MSTQAHGGASCPVLTGFDPMESEQAANPYPLLARARSECPVFYMPRYDLWCVTRYKDALAVIRDPRTYSSVGNLSYARSPLPPAIAAELGDDYAHPLTSNINTLDPPAHTRVRRFLQPSMTERRTREYESEIRAIAGSLVDQFVNDGRADLMSVFASPMVVRVITSILGLPAEQTEAFRDYTISVFAVNMATGLSEDELEAHWRKIIAMDLYIRGFVERCREEPKDGLASELIHARTDDPDRALLDEEVLREITTFVIAGSDTTATLIGHLVYLLLSHPEQLEEVRSDPSLIPSAVEEALRYLGSSGAIVRIATADVEIGGIAIPKGARIYIPLKGLNRDGSIFDNPDRFDIHRENASAHLALGIGTHLCLGAPLARLEASIALKTLIERIPTMRLGPNLGELQYTPSLIFSTLDKLEVEWT